MGSSIKWSWKPFSAVFGRQVELKSIADMNFANPKTGHSLSNTCEHWRIYEAYFITRIDAESNTYNNILVHTETLPVAQDTA